MSLYRRFKDRFGTAGVVLGVIALILALGGSAIAASGLNGKQKKEVKSIAKSFAGKPGAPGAAGANGTNGKDGAPGTNGTSGTPGADGKSVEAEAASPSKCEAGGTVFKIGGVEKGKACNGKQGEPGEPWTAGGTLPSEATETGAFGVLVPENNAALAPISFAIPLPAEISAANVHVEPTGFVGTPGADCPGSAAAPAAKAGHLCAYLTLPLNTADIEQPGIFKPSNVTDTEGAFTTGAIFKALAAPGPLSGSFAVTAP